jgi:catechol 2,3-dioxygenase-like lactoylglutathione lyase family enzyme
MTYPNTLIFVDFASDDPEASAKFYTEVFGWDIEPRPSGVFHRVVPGQNFNLDDGTQGPTGNLHLGISNVANRRPHPSADNGTVGLKRGGGGPRIWILVSDDDDMETMHAKALELGAIELWTHHFWAEFNGFSNALKIHGETKLCSGPRPDTTPISPKAGPTNRPIRKI